MLVPFLTSCLCLLYSSCLFRFPAYRRVLIDAGVAAADVNQVFDRWEADHAALDQHERDMMHDIHRLTDVLPDITHEQLQRILAASQQSTLAFARFIHQHLTSEEQYWVEQLIVQDRITEQQAHALGQTFAKTHLKKMKAKEICSLLTFTMSPLGHEQEQAVLKGLIPFPVRCYYNWFGRPAYMKAAPRLYLLAHGHITA